MEPVVTIYRCRRGPASVRTSLLTTASPTLLASARGWCSVPGETAPTEEARGR